MDSEVVQLFVYNYLKDRVGEKMAQKFQKATNVDVRKENVLPEFSEILKTFQDKNKNGMKITNKRKMESESSFEANSPKRSKGHEGKRIIYCNFVKLL
jgi:hypothetical protein